VTSPIDSELKQLVVGFVTEMYYAARRDGQDTTDGFESLLHAFITAHPVATWAGDLPRTPEYCDRLLSHVAEQTIFRPVSAFAYLCSLFNEFASHVEQTCPAIDVPEFLRQAGLRAASDETP
jgi:hypothetical protein